MRGAFGADPEAGGRLAAEWCSNCHYTGNGGVAGDAAPAFAEIANKPNATPEGWRAWLQDPHPPMPNLSLSRTEIDDLIAYIASLKSE
jgi:mono/diheme cytochrome c family protein